MPTSAYYYPTVTSGLGWTNTVNVTDGDADVASAAFSRTLNWPIGYSAVDTQALVVGTFTGLTSGVASGDDVIGIEIEVVARQTLSGPDATLSVTIGTEAETRTAALTDAFTTLTFGSTIDNFAQTGVVSALWAATSSVYLTASMTSSSGANTIEIQSIRMRIATVANAATPFTFTDATGVAIDTWSYSAVLSVTGIGAYTKKTYFTGDNGTAANEPEAWIQKNNDGLWHLPPYETTSVLGDCYQVRARAHGPAQVANGMLDIGGTSDVFSSTTVAADNNSDAFTLAPAVLCSTSSTAYCPTPVVVAGVNSRYGADDTIAGTAVCTISGATTPQYRVNDGPWRSSAISTYVKNGDVIEVSTATSASFNTSTTCTLSIGTTNAVFTATTRAVATVPNIFLFTGGHYTGAATYSSNTVTFTGIDSALTCTLTVHTGTIESSHNGGAWEAVPASYSIANGDTLQFRSAMGANASAVVLASFGSGVFKRQGFWGISTGTRDSTADFGAGYTATTAITGVSQTSNTINVTGVSLGGNANWISSGPYVQASVGGGAYGTTLVSAATPANMILKVTLPDLAPGGVTAAYAWCGDAPSIWNVTTRNTPAL